MHQLYGYGAAGLMIEEFETVIDHAEWTLFDHQLKTSASLASKGRTAEAVI
jgi:hypothetical protein